MMTFRAKHSLIPTPLNPLIGQFVVSLLGLFGSLQGPGATAQTPTNQVQIQDVAQSANPWRVGYQNLQVDLQRTPGAAAIPASVSIWYPTQADERRVPMGPFVQTVALAAQPQAEPSGRGWPLLLISHGTGGTELGHLEVARAAVRAGFVVAAITHPGDNYRDQSLRVMAAFWSERPRQISALLDELLAHPHWRGLIDAQRIGAFGHSAGGATVLTLAGAQPDVQRLVRHCSQIPDASGVTAASKDPTFCRLGDKQHVDVAFESKADVQQPAANTASLRDPRIRAVVAAAPVGAVFVPESVASIPIPTLLEAYGRDEVVSPRFHAEPLCAAWPQPGLSSIDRHCVHTPDAGHFAPFTVVQQRLPNGDGLDPTLDPEGFDRHAYLQALGQRVVEFVSRAWR